ncbi:reverse transcriptase domain-containing protein [Tanacetum coccineum]
MLGEHNITYRPRTSVKGQILANLHVEKPDEAPPDTSVIEIPQELWTLFTDGSSCVDGSGDGLILTSPEGMKFTYALRFQFTASNNEAEYKALIAGLQIAAQMGVRNVHVSVDSNLVANQVLGTYVAKEENMVKYLEKAKILINGFANFSISQVLVEVLKEKSIQDEEVATVVKEEGPTWITLIMEYLKDGTLPGGHPKAMAKIEAKAVATITSNQVKKFVWDNIVCHFGLSGEIVSNNGKQFSDNPFKDWCEKLNITQRFASVKHPQSNGLMERANWSLGKGIKSRLDAVHNNEELRLNLDLLEERRERAAIREAKTKLKMTKYYNARVRGVTFRPGDFVYRSNEASHAMDRGK